MGFGFRPLRFRRLPPSAEEISRRGNALATLLVENAMRSGHTDKALVKIANKERPEIIAAAVSALGSESIATKLPVTIINPYRSSTPHESIAVLDRVRNALGEALEEIIKNSPPGSHRFVTFSRRLFMLLAVPISLPLVLASATLGSCSLLGFGISCIKGDFYNATTWGKLLMIAAAPVLVVNVFGLIYFKLGDIQDRQKKELGKNARLIAASLIAQNQKEIRRLLPEHKDE